MSDSSYADEFGKWLEKSPNANEDEDSNDASDNSGEYAESEKLRKNLSYRRSSKLSSGSISDQAPILVDDDDDLFTTKKTQYEDEPPILEPVPNQLQSCKISAVQNPQFSPQICTRNYSRNNNLCSKKRSLKEHKKYSNKDQLNFISPDVCDESRHINSVKSKDSKSGNIFDKFIPENYDCPPPLIPSHEALQICSESPSSLAKNPSHSPNFCAMEADSTSEISGNKLNTVFKPQRLSKNSAHEVSVECDSTCMLAVSPIIVSPASISNGEMEETLDSGDGGNNEELESSGFKSKTSDNALERKTENEDQSTLMHIAIQKCLVDEMVHKDALNVKYFDKGSELQIADKLHCNRNPQIPGISTFSSSDLRSLSVDVDNDVQSNVLEYCTEPPVLSAVSPPSIRSHMRVRKEQYTFDSPKTFSRSRKRPHVKQSEHTDIACDDVLDVSSPPILDRVSETATVTLRCRRSRVVSEHSQNKCLNCHQDSTVSNRRQRRCNSLPVAGGTDYYGSLSENLHNFVTGTSELSDLQTHMHILLYRLFPQLKTELDAMSPESFKFESLLSDLVNFLEQPDDQDSSSPPPLILCRDTKPNCIYEYPGLTSELSCKYNNISDEPFSPLLSTSDFQAAADYAKIVVTSDAISCSNTSPTNLSSSYPHGSQSKQRQEVNKYQSDDKNLVAPLSRLSVRDMEDILTPSKVLLCKDPGASLKSCQTITQQFQTTTTAVPDNTTVSDNNTTVPDNNTTVSDNNTTVPDNNTAVSDNNTAVPDNNTTVPDNNTAVPDNTTVSDNNTTVSDNNTAVPDNNTAVPDNNTTVPDNNTAVPDNTTVSDNNTTVSDNNTTVSDNNTTVSDNNTTVPDNNTAVPDNNTAVSDNNTRVSDNNTTISDNNTRVSDNTTVPNNNTTVPNNTTVSDNNTRVSDNNTTVPDNNNSFEDLSGLLQAHHRAPQFWKQSISVGHMISLSVL